MSSGAGSLGDADALPAAAAAAFLGPTWRQGSRQAHRGAGRQAHRHTEAHRGTGTQARRHTGVQSEPDEGRKTQEERRRHAHTQAKSRAHAHTRAHTHARNTVSPVCVQSSLTVQTKSNGPRSQTCSVNGQRCGGLTGWSKGAAKGGEAVSSRGERLVSRQPSGRKLFTTSIEHHPAPPLPPHRRPLSRRGCALVCAELSECARVCVRGAGTS